MYINNNMDGMSRFPAGFVKAFQEYYTQSNSAAWPLNMNRYHFEMHIFTLKA